MQGRLIVQPATLTHYVLHVTADAEDSTQAGYKPVAAQPPRAADAFYAKLLPALEVCTLPSVWSALHVLMHSWLVSCCHVYLIQLNTGQICSMWVHPMRVHPKLSSKHHKHVYMQAGIASVSIWLRNHVWR